MKVDGYYSELSLGDVVRFREDIMIVHGVIVDPLTHVPSYWIHDFNGRLVPGTVQLIDLIPVP